MGEDLVYFLPAEDDGHAKRKPRPGHLFDRVQFDAEDMTIEKQQGAQRLIGNVSKMMQDRFFACLQTKL